MNIKPLDLQSLLEAVTKEQYKSVMKDIKNNSGFMSISPKDIKNIRNTQSYKNIFGNKQRLWFKLDKKIIEKPIFDNKNKELIKYASDVFMIYGILSEFYLRLDILKHYFAEHKIDISNLYINELYDISEELDKAFRSEYNSSNIEYILSNAYEFEEINFPYILENWVNNIIRIKSKNDSKVKTIKLSVLISLIKKQLSMINLDNDMNDIIMYTIPFDCSYNNSIRNYNDLISYLDSIIEKQRLKDREIPDKSLLKNKESTTTLYLCLSRYPADVMAMSTGQGWTSCQDLNDNRTHSNYLDSGYSNKNWHLKYDVAFGTCVVYLISETNINKSKKEQPNNPLFDLEGSICRFLVKPFYDENNNVYLTPGIHPVIYGNETYKDEIVSKITNYLEEKQSNISGLFNLPTNVYWDPIFNEHTNRIGKIVVNNGKITKVYNSENYMNDEEVFINQNAGISWKKLALNNTEQIMNAISLHNVLKIPEIFLYKDGTIYYNLYQIPTKIEVPDEFINYVQLTNFLYGFIKNNGFVDFITDINNPKNILDKNNFISILKKVLGNSDKEQLKIKFKLSDFEKIYLLVYNEFIETYKNDKEEGLDYLLYYGGADFIPNLLDIYFNTNNNLKNIVLKLIDNIPKDKIIPKVKFDNKRGKIEYDY